MAPQSDAKLEPFAQSETIDPVATRVTHSTVLDKVVLDEDGNMTLDHSRRDTRRFRHLGKRIARVTYDAGQHNTLQGIDALYWAKYTLVKSHRQTTGEFLPFLRAGRWSRRRQWRLIFPLFCLSLCKPPRGILHEARGRLDSGTSPLAQSDRHRVATGCTFPVADVCENPLQRLEDLLSLLKPSLLQALLEDVAGSPEHTEGSVSALVDRIHGADGIVGLLYPALSA